MRRSKYYKSCPRVFSSRLKQALCNRIDKFISEVPDTGRTDEEWIVEFLEWSRKQSK